MMTYHELLAAIRNCRKVYVTSKAIEGAELDFGVSKAEALRIIQELTSVEDQAVDWRYNARLSEQGILHIGG